MWNGFSSEIETKIGEVLSSQSANSWSDFSSEIEISIVSLDRASEWITCMDRQSGV